ncbi:hypothetical protein NP493_24g03000 [Ridgeia piscesae]|uniref:Uncharacterized protein n=1 Tax=Ridgeia piscesae TaxID=27915 RepID=A0AAD9PD95_RIDPI|nr:hypothetical protein NP493_24g03000 [Ridgeia piscesae]
MQDCILHYPPIGIKCKMKKLLTLLHLIILSFCNIHNILQDQCRNVHNPVCPVSYRNRLIPVSCNSVVKYFQCIMYYIQRDKLCEII